MINCKIMNAMKKIILFAAILGVYSIAAVAQPRYTFVDNWHLGFNAGPTVFFGDVTQSDASNSYGFSDLRPAFGIYLTKEIFCAYAVRGQLGYGWLAGSKDRYDDGTPADLSFRAHYFQYNLQSKISLSDLFSGGKCSQKANIYGFFGIGMINFQNKLYRKGDEVLSWGYGRDGSYKWVTEVIWPFGLGVDVRVGEKLKINLEVEAIWVDNDKLDRTFGKEQQDGFVYPSIGITYNISKFNRICNN